MDKAEQPLKIYLCYETEIGVNDKSGNPLYPEPNNETIVLKIKSYLESRGHDVWIPSENIKPEDDEEEVIYDAVENSDVFLFFMTRNSVRPDRKSQKLLSYAAHKRDGKVFFVKLEDEGATEYPAYLSVNQIYMLVDWRSHWMTDDIDELWLEIKLEDLAKYLEDVNVRSNGNELMQLQKILKPWNMNFRLQSLVGNTKQFYDEKAQDVKTFIHDEFFGRKSLFKLFEEKNAQIGSAESEKKDRVLWLKKEPWFGKSRFAAELYYKNYDKISAAYFIEYDKKETRDPQTFVMSVAYQLGRANPSYRKKLLSFLKENPDKINIHACDPQTLFQSLVVDLMSNEINEYCKTQWILVDALDAATNNDKNEIASLIIQNLANLPPWICFFITSRNNDEVVNEIFADFTPVAFSKEENDDDIHNFVQNEIEAMNLAVSKDVLDVLLKKSEGTFMYLEMFFRDLKEAKITLDVINNLPHGVIDDIHSQFNCYLNNNPEQFRMDICPALDCIFETGEPISRADVKKNLDIHDDSDLNKLLKELGTLIIQSGSSDKDVIKPFHSCVIECYNSYWKKLKVFISYGHEIGVKDESGILYPEPNNESVVIRIKKHLENRGHEVWLDKDKIKEGDEDWRRKIYEGIISSNVALICLSHKAMKPNGVCRDEISIAVGVRCGYPFSLTLEEMDISKYPAYLLTSQLFKEFENWKNQCVLENVINEAWLDKKMNELSRQLEEKDVRLYGIEMGKLKRFLNPWNMDSLLRRLAGDVKYLKNPQTNEWIARNARQFYGRESLFKLFEEQIKQGGKAIRNKDKRVLWLKKGPGFGKSRFAAEIRLNYRVIQSAQCILFNTLKRKLIKRKRSLGLLRISWRR